MQGGRWRPHIQVELAVEATLHVSDNAPFGYCLGPVTLDAKTLYVPQLVASALVERDHVVKLTMRPVELVITPSALVAMTRVHREVCVALLTLNHSGILRLLRVCTIYFDQFSL